MSEFQGIMELFMEPFSLVSITVLMNLFDRLVIITCNLVTDN